MSIGRFTRKAALWLGLSTLLGIAVALSLLRFWLLPEAARFKEDLEIRIGGLIHESIRIEQVAARLHRLQPELVLQGLQILDGAGQPAIRFSELRAGIDPIASLAAGEPVFSHFRIVGVHLSVLRQPDGKLTLAGLNPGGEMPAWLLADGHFELLDGTLDYRDLADPRPTLLLGRAQVHLHNQGQRHRFSFSLAETEGRGGRILLSADMQGGRSRLEDWSGPFYLESRQLDLGRFGNAVLPKPVLPFSRAQADFRAWGRWHRGLQKAAGDFRLSDVAMATASAPSPDFTGATGRFSLARHEAEFRLDLHDLRPNFRRPWPATALAFAWRPGGEAQPSRIRLAASYLNLGDLAPAISSLPSLRPLLPLSGLDPKGALLDFRLLLAPDAPLGERWSVCAQLDGVAIKPVGGSPGISGLDGSLCGSEGSGRADLKIREGKLSLPASGIQQPILVKQGDMPLAWSRDHEKWRFSTAGLKLENADFGLAIRGSLEIPEQPGASVFADFRGRMLGPEVNALKNILPSEWIPATSLWMKAALTKGRVTQTDFLVRGALGDFPFANGEGVFQARVDAEDIEMRFHPDWQPLTGASLTASFEGSAMDIDARRGRVGSGDVRMAHAHVDDLNRKPWLDFAGTVQASVAGSLDYLVHSPIRRIPERLLRYAQVSGDTEIALKLAIPLDPRLGEIRLEGQADFQEAGLSVHGLGLNIDQMKGPLHFTRSGLQAGGIRARLLDAPILVDVRQKDGDIGISLSGKASIDSLQKQIPLDAWRFASGTAEYRAELHIPESLDADSAPLKVGLESDLKGIALQLPPPFGKPAQTRRDLELAANFQTGSKTPVEFNYGNSLRARLRLSEPAQGFTLEGGEIGIEHTPPARSSEPGLTIAAHFESFDIDEWRRWIDGAQERSANTLPIRRADLQTRKMTWSGRDFGPFSLALWRQDRTWLADVGGRSAKGQINVSADALRLNFEYFRWPEAAKQSAALPSAGSAMPLSTLDPASIPPINLSVGKVFVKAGELGHLQLVTERRPEGMAIKTLSLSDDRHKLTVQGHWSKGKPGETAKTHLDGKARVEDLGRSLTPFGYGGEIRGTPADAIFVLEWPGAPQDFDKGRVAGQVNLDLGKGAVNKVEPGLGRVLGMLNFDTIWRRLNLDFSDLFAPGLAYDRIAGTFTLGGGQALTENFLIDAVPAKILIDGRAGLVKRDLEQTVTVIPHTTVALPIAGALAGGPAVGAAVLVAQQLVGDKIDTIAATQYSIRGDWDDAKVTRIDRNLPMDVINKAWTGMKDLSGLGGKQEETTQ